MLSLDDTRITVDGQTDSAFSSHRLAWSLRHHLARSGQHRDESPADTAYWLAQTIGEALTAFAATRPHGTIAPRHIVWLAYDTLARYDAAAALTYGVEHKIVTPSGKPTVRPSDMTGHDEHFIYL